MPVAKGTSLDPARTREGILAAATGLLYRHGLDGVGVSELCRAVGASKETLYRHFGSKDGLIAAVLEERSARVTHWIAEAATAAGPRPADRLAAVFDALGEWYAEPDFRGCAIVNAATQRHADPARAIAATHLGRYLTMLGDIAADAEAADPGLLARQLLMLLEGATVVADHHDTATAAADAKAAALALLATAAPTRKQAP
ncbi:TetR/AcrR family transcriptional regulator [Phytomonospora endophytica]|uniref:AcrR family transcriptional regulator n=1 Tax=Phytomonospora endophytica TaxID=714109 RepID=A0A841FHU3_9ACTN|nr:TetR/AcrR family transcriptional regulator [Phytomonospora endophytica]MBB6036911.1 AcrR family transcriptional regulator [Phytomonospora endophytica]GIG68057.1 TetR family transcriptional regulator [Phytomonospora endophytica]